MTGTLVYKRAAAAAAERTRAFRVLRCHHISPDLLLSRDPDDLALLTLVEKARVGLISR